ncbi:MAG: RNA methyltransferase [Bacteroidales bacterium]|nr:RNA methyltransferase [Bacteroidales bacterium]
MQRTTISKAKLKELAAYKQAKHCDEDNLFVVEGEKMAAEALHSKVSILAICATSEWLDANTQLPHCNVFEVDKPQLERLSLMRTPNKVWMLIDRNLPPFHSTSTLSLALDHIQDPGNMGTLLRTADWFGVRQVVCSADTVSVFNPKVVQASMGAIFRTKVEYTDLPQWLDSCGKDIYGAVLNGQTECRCSTRPSVLVIGNESRGISAEVLAKITHRITIPNIGGTAESLNAAVAAGILMHHLTSKL